MAKEYSEILFTYLYSGDSGITKNTALPLCVKVEHEPNPNYHVC
jgi:hypothetical protein